MNFLIIDIDNIYCKLEKIDDNITNYIILTLNKLRN